MRWSSPTVLCKADGNAGVPADEDSANRVDEGA